MMLSYHKMGELTLGAGDSDSIIDLFPLVPSLDFLLKIPQEFSGFYELRILLIDLCTMLCSQLHHGNSGVIPFLIQ